MLRKALNVTQHSNSIDQRRNIAALISAIKRAPPQAEGAVTQCLTTGENPVQIMTDSPHPQTRQVT